MILRFLIERPSPAPSPTSAHVDDRIPVWPPDISAIFYGRLSNSEWKVPWHDTSSIAARFGVPASFEYGRLDPLRGLHDLSTLYAYLTDSQTADVRTRAERTTRFLVSKQGAKFLESLPLGIAAPLREAARTCQLAPPSSWPLHAYMAVGRNDLAASASNAVEQVSRDGFKSKDLFVSVSHCVWGAY